MVRKVLELYSNIKNITVKKANRESPINCKMVLYIQHLLLDYYCKLIINIIEKNDFQHSCIRIITSFSIIHKCVPTMVD